MREADCIMVDEIGPMELQGKDFQRTVLHFLDGTKPVIGIINWRMNHPVIDAIKARKDVRIYEITSKNQDVIPDDIAREILEKNKVE